MTTCPLWPLCAYLFCTRYEVWCVLLHHHCSCEEAPQNTPLLTTWKCQAGKNTTTSNGAYPQRCVQTFHKLLLIALVLYTPPPFPIMKGVHMLHAYRQTGLLRIANMSDDYQEIMVLCDIFMSWKLMRGKSADSGDVRPAFLYKKCGFSHHKSATKKTGMLDLKK